ncbi:hypothetical protein SCA6_000188 [Theobroma cacao]
MYHHSGNIEENNVAKESSGVTTGNPYEGALPSFPDMISDFPLYQKRNGWMVPVSMITMLVFKVLDECFMCSDSVFAADFVAIIAAGCSWSLIFMFGCVFQALSGLALSSCSVNVQV